MLRWEGSKSAPGVWKAEDGTEETDEAGDS